MPATKSFRSGTWASTLLPTMRSALPYVSTTSSATAVPKNRTRVGMPSATATAATLAAGSIPSTRTPRSRNGRSR